MIIEQGTSATDKIIAQHFYQLWLDNNFAADLIRDDWLEFILNFIQKARQELEFQSFVAKIEAEIVGSVSCQLFAGLYPSPFKIEHFHYGYIWNVYVQPDYRRQGIATELTNTAINYLKDINCTKALLHASPLGKPVYENIGFIPGNEMILDLAQVGR